MYVVENTSDTVKRFNEADPKGGFRTVRLAPGESGTFDIDPGQARFHRGGLKATPVTTEQSVDAAPVKQPTKPRKAAPKRAKA